MQGTSSEIKFRNLSYSIHHLGDLMYWIGLNINDLHTHSIRWTFRPWKNWTIGTGAIFTTNFMFGSYNNSQSYGCYPVYEPGLEIFLQHKNTHVFLEFSTLKHKYTPKNWEHFSEKYRHALVAGLETRIKGNKTTITLSTSYRYYGLHYLQLFYMPYPSYRDQDTTIRANNTIGDFLYPLENYFRPVSQFSVFSESQKFPNNLMGVELESDFNYQFNNRFFNSLNIEAIFLWRSKAYYGRDPFLYFYYTNMLSYQPDPKLLISFVITNKMMDLDASYHAHYMTVTPFLGFSIWKMI